MRYEDVLSKNKVEDVIKDYITLEKEGSLYKGHCPWDGEEVETLFVNPKLQRWHCLLCWRGGDSASFISYYENITIRAALTILENRKEKR